jgi:RNA polymerase sigma-70 factor (ECF subfamily)
VVQEAFVEATVRFEKYVRDAKLPFFLWLRFLTMQKLCQLHRRHLGVKARDVSREFSLYNGPTPEASSAALAAQLVGKLTTPSQAAVRAETRLQLEQALNSMDLIDREVLALRHFEQLSNAEVARVLQISESAASNRYVRAAKRLRSLLERG